MREELSSRYPNFQRIQHFCKSPPDFIIPLPEEVDPRDDHLLTPFPFFLEAPLLNPCIPHEVIVKDIIENAGHNNEDDYLILEKILQNDPSTLKEEYFLDKLQSLMKSDNHLII